MILYNGDDDASINPSPFPMRNNNATLSHPLVSG